MPERTNLESELFEGIGEARYGLVTRTGLCNQRQSAGRACDFPVGDLHTSRLRDIVLETRSGSRGHAPTAAGASSRALLLERTGRIPAESRPRQHHRMCERDRGGRGEWLAEKLDSNWGG